MRECVFYFFLIIIVNERLIIAPNLIYKCCEKQISKLDNETFICHNSTRTNVFRINAVFNETSNGSKCIDNFNKKVSIFNRQNNSYIKLEDIEVSTKCCPVNYFYNNTRRSCENVPNKTNSFNKNILKIGLPHCRIITDITLQSKSELIYNSTFLHLQKSDEFFTGNQFCLDETVHEKYVARICRDWSVCDKIKCIKKCCVDGKSFINGSHCEDTFVHGLEFDSLESFVGEINDDFAIVHGYSGKVYLEPNVSNFFLDQNGIFHNKKTDDIYLHPSQPYCIEHARKSKVLNRYAYFGFLTKQSPPLAQKFLWNRVAMIISSGFLILTIIFYIISRETRKIFGKTLVCFCCSLLVLYVILVYHTFDTNLHLSKTKWICKTLGFFIIYLGFCCFIWLQLMCFDINSTFGTTSRYLDKNEKRRREFKKFLIYNLYGWGIPFILTILIVIFHLTHSLPNSISVRIANTKCGIEKGNYSEIVFRAVPLTIIQIVNSVYFVKTVRYVLQVKREIRRMIETPATLKKKKKFFARQQRFGLVVKLSVTMGIFYLFEVISSFFDFNDYKATAILEIIWDFINCLQGLFIFLIFVCKRKNFEKLKKSTAIERIRKMSLTTTSRKTSSTTLANINTV